jgi:hypothetical protein
MSVTKATARSYAIAARVVTIMRDEEPTASPGDMTLGILLAARTYMRDLPSDLAFCLGSVDAACECLEQIMNLLQRGVE